MCVCMRVCVPKWSATQYLNISNGILLNNSLSPKTKQNCFSSSVLLFALASSGSSFYLILLFNAIFALFLSIANLSCHIIYSQCKRTSEPRQKYILNEWKYTQKASTKTNAAFVCYTPLRITHTRKHTHPCTYSHKQMQ